MKGLLYLVLLALPTLLMHCSNTQKLLSKGNYEKSYKISLKELKKGKASSKDLEILNTSLDKIYQEQIEAILESENGASLEDGVNAYNGYQGLEHKFKEAIKYLNVKNNERYTSILDRRANLEIEMYEDFKIAGIAALKISKENEDRGAGRAAFENFENAKKFNATSEIEALLEEAYEYAVTILVIETEAPYNPSFEFEIEREFKRVENNGSKFQRAFYDRNQKNADCIINVSFEQFDFRSNFQTFTRDFTRDIAVSRTVTNADGELVTITENQIATCTLYTDQTVSGLRIYADIVVIPQTDHCRSSRDNYQDFYEEIYEEYRVVGDRRALPPEYNRNSTGQRPRDSDLVEVLVRKFYNNFALEYL